MSTLAIVLIAVFAVMLLFFLGGLVVARRRAKDPEYEHRIEAADRALEQARASDRGWDRGLIEEAAMKALAADRPDFPVDHIDLVLVDDRPGVTEDRAEVVAHGSSGRARVVLTRREAGDWMAERID